MGIVMIDDKSDTSYRGILNDLAGRQTNETMSQLLIHHKVLSLVGLKNTARPEEPD